jgi:hypothetical protein
VKSSAALFLLLTSLSCLTGANAQNSSQPSYAENLVASQSGSGKQYGIMIPVTDRFVTPVKSGQVTSVFSYEGKFFVVVASKDYMYVYNGLKQVSVTPNSVVAEGDMLGEAVSDRYNFQVWSVKDGKPNILSPAETRKLLDMPAN